MLLIPLQAVANQTASAPLSNQSVILTIYTRASDLFMDVFVGSKEIVVGVICQDRNRIVRDLYLGFQGDFAFFDTQGKDDPVYTGLGDRFLLIYLEPSDLPPGVG